MKFCNAKWSKILIFQALLVSTCYERKVSVYIHGDLGQVNLTENKYPYFENFVVVMYFFVGVEWKRQ